MPAEAQGHDEREELAALTPIDEPTDVAYRPTVLRSAPHSRAARRTLSAARKRRKISFTSIIVSSEAPMGPLLAHPKVPGGDHTRVCGRWRGADYASWLMSGPMRLENAWPHDPGETRSRHRCGVAP